MNKVYILALLLWQSVFTLSAQQTDMGGHSTHQPAENSVQQSILPQATALYACPMHPHIKRDAAGNCPICGMDLQLQRQQTTGSISVDGAMQQALAIRTETAAKRTLWRFIQTFAQVTYAEDAIHHSHIRAEGWIEQLFVRSLGQRVKAGDKLFSYYAPDLLVAQDDYLQALSVSTQNGERSSSLLNRAETRLRLLGLSDKDINQLKQSRQSQYQISVYAHQDGVVTMLNVRDGMYIKPGDTLIEITSLNRVWLLADVAEAQQSWLFEGMSAEVDIPSQQLSGIETTVDYIYPALDAQSRSSKVRLSVENSKQLLKPNMLLPVRLYGGALKDVLTIPRDAVLPGANSNRVIVQTGDSFTVRQISTGSSAQGYVQVLSGLHEGEQVVVSGQFLLDAEASLSQLPPGAANSHQH
ncbi:MAG: efflux RND transporter periplasmic adaptor subunit [Gammaproteobacteria bacterium]|nr:efflux RND transporter periplasmic adaptor subunit [Gammaproteobacteria bacterium]MBU2070089.1 efflux RND transporter periplasmic adaptor subunit [Gammaproteobacteria bacterium]MBU2183615.1 efflux RND transporter periplasmic adaptor subunit [Gammaproteobacteria bacterium]MBU2205623.1 efflux RND transporter periplasmic adaptor subunit [Gammaproteobacteria bacterium]